MVLLSSMTITRRPVRSMNKSSFPVWLTGRAGCCPDAESFATMLQKCFCRNALVLSGGALCGVFATRSGFGPSDFHHLEVFLAGLALGAGPVRRYVLPARAGRDAFVGQAGGLVVDEAADQTHVLLVVGSAHQSGCSVIRDVWR